MPERGTLPAWHDSPAALSGQGALAVAIGVASWLLWLNRLQCGVVVGMQPSKVNPPG